MNTATLDAAKRVRDVLQTHQLRLVLAESCTAGRIAATLAELPGISQFLCGSFVVYRNDSKHQWLDIPCNLLEDPSIGPVSPDVTRRLAEASLRKTPEADLAFAITGDVGPGAPSSSDGKVFCHGLFRATTDTISLSLNLTYPAPADEQDTAGRRKRLDQATEMALTAIKEFILQSVPSTPPK